MEPPESVVAAHDTAGERPTMMPMPGQRRRREREARRRAAREQRESEGRWEVVFETTDEAEWRAFRARPAGALDGFADEDLRVDVLCGRGTHPTTYRLSALVPRDPDPGRDFRNSSVPPATRIR
jgi:hypothetical protein